MKVKHSTTNFKALEPFLKVVEENEGYAKFVSEGYMDLSMEKLWYSDHEGNPVYSICHYGEMNGDLMRDPEMTFSVNWDEKTILPLSFQNDYMGFYIEYFVYRNGKLAGYRPRWLHDGDDFLWTWGKNLAEQGFTPENRKEQNYTVTEWNI